MLEYRIDLVFDDLPTSRSHFPGTNPLKITASILWWLCIVIWCAAIAVPGGAAIASFTRLPAVEATMPGIAEYFAGDPAGAGRFVAGYVTNPIFLVSDKVCLGSALGCLLALLLSGFQPCGPGRAGKIAVFSIMIAGAAMTWYLWRLAPELGVELQAWREAVLANDRPRAEAAWSRFDPLHLTAARLMNLQLAMLIVTVIAGAIASVRPTRRKVRHP